MSLVESEFTAGLRGKNLSPVLSESHDFKNWVTELDSHTCDSCRDMNGKIYLISEDPDPKPPLHPRCRCKIIPMEAIQAGTATINGTEGADWWEKNNKTLPDYYIGKEELTKLGWRIGEKPSRYAPNKTFSGGVYLNDDNHLPSAPGRTWQEADINYVSGKRNTDRILFSNDGLIFVTYDHYGTFYEII